MLQEAIDRCAVDRFEDDATELKPGQEVTGGTRMESDMAFGNPLTAEIVDKRMDDWVEAGQCRGRHELAAGG